MSKYKMINNKVVQLTVKEENEIAARNTELNNQAPNRNMEELRRQRDLLLAETDFYALGDVTMSDNMKTYRQALRDITSQTPSDNLLSNINWPTKPS